VEEFLEGFEGHYGSENVRGRVGGKGLSLVEGSLSVR
jgi:hypothetical protein